MPRSPALIIDGYNLLQESGIFGRVDRRTALEGSRTALLDYLTQALTPRHLARSVIVFDAQDAPPGLPHDLRHAGLRVLFSRNLEDADTVIERLLDEHKEPREVLVVSSDHRLQRAARRCGAKYIDSGAWFLELREAAEKAERGKGRARGAGKADDIKPERPVSRAEVEQLAAEFGPIDEAELLPPNLPLPHVKEGTTPASADPAAAAKNAKSKKPRRKKNMRPDEADDRGPLNLANPFPPGYTDDLFEK